MHSRDIRCRVRQSVLRKVHQCFRGYQTALMTEENREEFRFCASRKEPIPELLRNRLNMQCILLCSL